MADLKISQLVTANTPLAGTEVLPIVQSGSTKKVTVASLTAGRAVGSAGGTFTDNFVQGTAAKGVNFTANAPAAGMTGQLLNWYEEGTFTPTLTSWTIVGAESHQGFYVRVGRQVTVVIQLNAATSLASSGSSYIGGLPFSVGLTSVATMAVMTDTSGTGSASNGYVTGTTIYPGSSAATAHKFLTVTYFVA